MRINDHCRVTFTRRSVVAQDYGVTFVDATGAGVHVGAVCKFRGFWLARDAARGIERERNTREAATKALLHAAGYITDEEAGA